METGNWPPDFIKCSFFVSSSSSSSSSSSFEIWGEGRIPGVNGADGRVLLFAVVFSFYDCDWHFGATVQSKQTSFLSYVCHPCEEIYNIQTFLIFLQHVRQFYVAVVVVV